MWKCDTCIHKEKRTNLKEICVVLCKDIYIRINIENSKYQEEIKKPPCCGKCPYILKHMLCI